MQNLALYSSTVLIWGSTWFVITFQLGVVSADLSVAYRYALAAAILIAYAAIRGRFKPRDYSLKNHVFMALQGLFLFCLNYWIFYLATGYLTSGLVAVTFSTITVMNMVNQAIFFRKRVEGRTILASLLGLGGIAFVFRPEISSFDLESGAVIGLGLCMLATYLASLGNMASIRNSAAGLPVTQVNTYGMTYGALFMFLIALASGSEFTFDTSFDYLWSLFYLAVFGSILGFGGYLTLIKRIGADKGAYAAVLFPIVALAISTVFEDYRWSPEALAGVALILLGNLMILAPKNLLMRLAGRRRPA